MIHDFIAQLPQQWGTEDAETKVSSIESLELDGSPFKVTCFLKSPFRSIHFLFVVANTDVCVDLQNKIGHPALRHDQQMQVPVLEAR